MERLEKDNSALELTSAAVLASLQEGGPADEAAFDALIRQVHDVQCAAIPLLTRLANQRQRDVGKISTWRDLPAVPAPAYKRFDLYGGTTTPARVFQSSGTMGGPERVSRASYSETGLRLMDEAIRQNARRMLFPEGRTSRILVLAPSPEVAPQLIMAYGMARLIETFGLPGSQFLIAPGSFDVPRIVGALAAAIADGTPVTLIGASFGFVHLLDAMEKNGIRLHLPDGSRCMDAGGFKGRSREVSALELRASMQEWLGVPAHRAVNLLGMTELPSQLYEDGLAAEFERRPALLGKRVPPWMRVQVLDPERLEPAPTGVPGLISCVDLANVERPLALLTEDMGVMEPDGSFHILGRASGADAKGCSISLDALVQAVEKTRDSNP